MFIPTGVYLSSTFLECDELILLTTRITEPWAFYTDTYANEITTLKMSSFYSNHIGSIAYRQDRNNHRNETGCIVGIATYKPMPNNKNNRKRKTQIQVKTWRFGFKGILLTSNGASLLRQPAFRIPCAGAMTISRYSHVVVLPAALKMIPS